MQHLACIMDGNRRWARQHGLSRVGRDGIEAAYRVADACIVHKIPYLSLFAFSLENFKRAPQEVAHLFDLMVAEMHAQAQMFIDKNIKITFVGDMNLLPDHVRLACDQLCTKTKDGSVLQVSIFICYGARQELVAVARRIAHDIHVQHYTPQDITEKLFSSYLWTDRLPDPDLIIRTGGAHRLSNFLLYQAAYAELYFLDCLWPAITVDDIAAAYAYFTSCKRNFGI